MRKLLSLGIIGMCAAVTTPASAQKQPLGFFVSSTGSGMGANLGGLAGADKHC
jgi:hypothetical protein